jgi:hypothetical protein
MAALQEASAWIARVSGGRAGAQYPGSLSAVAVPRGRRHFALCECDQSDRGHRRHGRRAWLLARAMTAFQEASVCSTRRKSFSRLDIILPQRGIYFAPVSRGKVSLASSS